MPRAHPPSRLVSDIGGSTAMNFASRMWCGEKSAKRRQTLLSKKSYAMTSTFDWYPLPRAVPYHQSPVARGSSCSMPHASLLVTWLDVVSAHPVLLHRRAIRRMAFAF